MNVKAIRVLVEYFCPNYGIRLTKEAIEGTQFIVKCECGERHQVVL